MSTIDFAGLQGEIISESPHSNYLVVKLSDRVYICGTYSNQFNWESSPDEESGFESFITYIGVRSQAEADKFQNWAIAHGSFTNNPEESIPRKSKRVKGFPYEMKVRNLLASDIPELVKMG